MSYLIFLALVIAGLVLMFWTFPLKTSQSHTQAAFDIWAQGCRTQLACVTVDERGTRAFIVTCSPGGEK